MKKAGRIILKTNNTEHEIYVWCAWFFFLIISYGASSVTQERWNVGCCNSETSNGRYKEANTLANEAKYTTNKGLYVDSYFLELPKMTLQVRFPD